MSDPKQTLRDEVYDTIQAVDEACGEVLSGRQSAILSMMIGIARQHEDEWWTEKDILEFCDPGCTGEVD